jgi:hypothetical protein
MSPRLLVLSIALLCLPAQAIDWPWQEEGEVRYDFCRGFTVASLNQSELGELSRTNLWLAWNYIVRQGPASLSLDAPDYISGMDQFTALVGSGDMQAIETIADGDCALGRN